MAHADPSVPFKQRWFEDYPVGEVHEFGDYLVTAEEIIDFATRYDPQAFHVDPDAARASNFGGLVASGWMTASVMMRLLVDHVVSAVSSMGSPGIDELRWLKPVRPGDRLRGRLEIVESRRSVSKPDRGIVHMRQQVLNQHGEVVMSYLGMGMYRCRPRTPTHSSSSTRPAE